MAPQIMQSSFLALYLPALVIIVGTVIAKKEWLPYAGTLAGILGIAGVMTSSRGRAILKPDEFRKFPLTKKTVTSHNTAIYRFGLPKQTDILGLPIGQHISVGATVEGKKDLVVRSYTPITSDEQQGHFDLMIKSYPQGNISRIMGELQVGDTMDFKGPKGSMIYTPNMVKHFGMIAGGTGITPMLQIVRAIIRGRPRNGGKDTTKIDLIFANVNEEDILLRKDLDTINKGDRDINIHYVLQYPPEGWNGGVGFVTPDNIKDHLPGPGPDMKLLVCGPPPMVSAMKKATESVGYEKARVVSKLQDQVFCF
ncbi:MAG: NADH-cytochrome b5 reductase [Alyxoria varia]|nr:MAG: NADH-cytochrome b5 reductase [Alyxoria varia]